MRLAGIDHRLQLCVGQEIVDVGRKMRPIGRLGRRDRGHRGRLHELGRMRLRYGNTDRLQSVLFVDGVREAARFAGLPVERLIGERQTLRFGHGCGRDLGGGAIEIAAHAAERGRGDHGNDDGRIDGKPRGQLLVEPYHEHTYIRRDARRSGEHGGIVGWPFVDDGQPRRKRRAVLGIDRTIDGGGEHDAAALLQTGEGGGPGWIVGREARAGDRHETTAGREARERRGDVAEGSVGHTALDIGHDRERRIHQHDARYDRGIEVIVDLGRVEAGDGKGRKEGGEKTSAHLGQFVENERAASDLGENGEEASAGGWLQHPVGWRDGGGMSRGQAERDRRRKLLKGLALGRAPRMRRQKAGDLRQRDKPCSRRTGFAEKRLSVFAQEQDGRRLAGVICRLPVPGAACVGRAECVFHRRAQGRGVNTLAAFEMRQ